jgi:hypothetical protein
MSFSWTDNNGNTFPISLQPGETASVLLMFRPRHEHVHVLPALQASEEEMRGGAFGGAGGSFTRKSTQKRKMMNQGLERVMPKLARIAQ